MFAYNRLDRREALKGMLLAAGFGGTLPGSLTALARFHQQPESEEENASAGPLVMSEEQRRVLMEAAERIVPSTDTPGAKEAGVHLFADRLLAEWCTEPVRRAFLQGLDELEAKSQERFEGSFAELDDERRDLLLRELEDAAFAARQGQPWALQPDVVEPEQLEGLELFDVLRWMVLVGYYTSEVGMREELGFRMVPGRYDGCIPPADGPDGDQA